MKSALSPTAVRLLLRRPPRHRKSRGLIRLFLAWWGRNKNYDILQNYSRRLRLFNFVDLSGIEPEPRQCE